MRSRFAAPEHFEELERRGYDETEFVILRVANPGSASLKKANPSE